MTSPAYSEATIELVARVLEPLAKRGPSHDPSRCLSCRVDAKLVLDALAAAGLLLPEGAETRTERLAQIQPGDWVAFRSPALFPTAKQRVEAKVVRVGDDGYVTVSVPQGVFEPMEVTGPADEFVRVRSSPAVEAAFRAGRAQAAADIRAHADDEAHRPNRRNSSHLIEEWLREAALIAEGVGEADQSKEQT